MLKIVCPPGIQFSGETVEQMDERDRRNAEHNAWVDRELKAWAPGPAAFYSGWLREHAPHLLRVLP